MRGLSAFLTEHVVGPLREMGLPVDLQTIQLVMVLGPVAIVVAAFLRAGAKKKQRMRDAGM